MRTPWPLCGSHQCCTSPSGNWRAAARRICSRSSCWLRQPQRHRVLQLVAEAIRAARLVETGACPGAAGQRLIEQPAIHHDVERTVRRLDLHVTRELFPVRAHRRRAPRRRRRRDSASARRALRRHPPPRLAGIRIPCSTRVRVRARAQRCARIESRACASREWRAGHQRRRRVEHSMTTQELVAVAGEFGLCATQIGERHAGKGLVPGIARKQRAAAIQLREDVRRAAGA